MPSPDRSHESPPNNDADTDHETDANTDSGTDTNTDTDTDTDTADDATIATDSHMHSSLTDADHEPNNDGPTDSHSTSSNDDSGRSRLFDTATAASQTVAEHTDDEFTPLQPAPGNAAAATIYDDGPTAINWLFRKGAVRELLSWACDRLVARRTNDFLNKTEISEEAPITRQSVTEYADLLVKLDIFETKGKKRTLYRVREDSTVLQQLVELNDTIVDKDPDPRLLE